MGLRVVELFAGVGGFREGLHNAGHKVVWWNQWEPSTKRVQHAFDCYVNRYCGGKEVDPIHNADIHEVSADAIPDHDLLVAGFPCQDFSVASPLRHAKGLKGNKGALWGEIARILARKSPPYILLENVDRLLRSPPHCRGRDFSVILATLAEMRYAVEWRVIKADDYGEPQRRRRIFIFASKFNTPAGEHIRREKHRADYLARRGFFGPEFPSIQEPQFPPGRQKSDGWVGTDPKAALRRRKEHDFRNSGVMVSGRYWTKKLDPNPESPRPVLRTFIKRNVPKEFYVPQELIPRWEAAKDVKAVPKKAKGGYTYIYKEGKVPFPDSLDQPARTLLTVEGGLYPSRSNHIIKDPWRKEPPFYRILTPEECEKLMGFHEGHTAMLPRRWRYFTMGNALMVGLVRRMGHRLNEFTKDPAVKPAARKQVAKVPKSAP